MGYLGRVALTTSTIFLIVMAVMLNSPALFYMSSALLATIGASRMQAWFSLQKLRFARKAPEAVKVGEETVIELTATSERRIRRPLVRILDLLPPDLHVADRRPTVPLAPAYGESYAARYSFRPLRRGRYRWSRVRVQSTDALGLVAMEREYEATPTELLVLPAPAAERDFPLPRSGMGDLGLDDGQRPGRGLSFRGVREYREGDPLNYIHWSSTARRGVLTVKEFDTGEGIGADVFIQTTRGTDLGPPGTSTLDSMCAHAAYLLEQVVKLDATMCLPALEGRYSGAGAERKQAVYRMLAELRAFGDRSLCQELLDSRSAMNPEASLYVFVSMPEADLVSTIRALPHRSKYVLTYTEDARAMAHELQRAGCMVVAMRTLHA